MHNRLPLTIACAVLWSCGAAFAQVKLPLDGYCRAGRCMPVRIESPGPAMRISGDGVVPTEISATRVGVVPLLILSDVPGSLRIDSTDIPLHPLFPNQRLVGVAGDLTAPADLFPGESVVTVNLDRSHPIPGPAIAWETLDAIVIDGGLEPNQIPDLLAMGITIAVHASEKPDAIWPWKHNGDFWLLRPEIAGPLGSIGGEVAYLPAASWHPGMPVTLRRRIVLAAVVICLLLLAALLIRSKWSPAIMIVITLTSIVAIELWRRSQPVLHSAGGAIVVAGSDFVQQDVWQFQAAGSASGEGNSQLNARPMLIDAQAANAIGLKLICVADAEHWTYSLSPNARLALLRRTIDPPRSLPPVQSTSLSPLHELARQDYLSAMMHIQGEIAPPASDPDEDAWPAVVVGR